MTKEEFDKFVEQKTRDEKPAHPIDWKKKKLEWLERLGDFYSEVEKYLEEYIQSGKIKIETSKISINEPDIGTYMAVTGFQRLGRNMIFCQSIY